DQMRDMGFIHPVKQIVSFVPKEHQTLFFSATMPKEIAALAKQFLNDPATVSVTPPATTAERIVQQSYFVNQNEKQALLTHIVRGEEIDRALVFTRTKYGADKVVRALAGAGVNALAIHGDKSQGQRTAALQAFRNGQVKLLVATDIAARGIDVSGLSHVINFELPNNPDQYVHRIGRTGRAGMEGVAISLVSDDERAFLKAIEKLTRTRSEITPLPENLAEMVRNLPKPAPRKQADARPPRPQQMREKQPRQHRERGERSEQGDSARSFHPRRRKSVGAYKGAVTRVG
nr:DEAD/DEAH box helicase [Sphingobium sp.]